jgi:hypothetical protein
MDEKGFLIGICQTSKRIISIKTMRKGFTKGHLQDGSREFISLLGGISATGEKMPPSLIYQSDSGDLQTTWLEDFDHCNQFAYFAASEKGWTTNDHGMKWLERFHQQTVEKASGGLQKRLLLLDGHVSHVNIAFIEKAISYNILIAVFPPHSTHRLQPLDVSVFSPLANYYSQELDKYIQQSRGFSRMTKRVFWSVFWPAWQKGVREETITSGFRKTGIHPFSPRVVLDQLPTINNQSSSEDSEKPIELALDIKSARKLTKNIRKKQQPVSKEVDALLKSVEALTIKNEILRYENTSLSETIIDQKKRQKRGKSMGLIKEDEPKYGQFFSPNKIDIRRAEMDEEEKLKEQEKQLKNDQKVQAQLDREEKAEAHRLRVARNKKEREEKKAAKEREKLERRLDRERAIALKATKPPSKKTQKPSRITQKGNSSGGEKGITDSEVFVRPTMATRLGRIPQLPPRFQE